MKRALIYADPMEMNVLPDRIIQQFESGYGTCTIRTDGRKVLMDPDQRDAGAIRPVAGSQSQDRRGRVVK